MARSIKFYVVVTLSGVVFSIFFTEFASTLTKYIYMLQDLIGLNKSGGESDFMSPWNLKYATLLSLFLLASTLIKRGFLEFHTIQDLFFWFMLLLLLASSPITCNLSPFCRILFCSLYNSYGEYGI